MTGTRTRRWMLALGVSSAAALAVGFPLMVLNTAGPREPLSGQVISVDPGDRTVVLRLDHRGTGGSRVTLHIPAGTPVGSAGGDQPLTALVPGERVRVELKAGSPSDVRRIRLDG